MKAIKKEILDLFKGMKQEKEFQDEIEFIFTIMENKYNTEEKMKKALKNMKEKIEDLKISEIRKFINDLLKFL